MEKSGLGVRIMMEIESLISRSCILGDMTSEFQELHKKIIKRHYNALDATIDYHRRRVCLYVDQSDAGPGIEICEEHGPLYVNLRFTNLQEFLFSCLDQDTKSLAFYIRLLRSYSPEEVPLIAV